MLGPGDMENTEPGTCSCMRTSGSSAHYCLSGPGIMGPVDFSVTAMYISFFISQKVRIILKLSHCDIYKCKTKIFEKLHCCNGISSSMTSPDGYSANHDL